MNVLQTLLATLREKSSENLQRLRSHLESASPRRRAYYAVGGGMALFAAVGVFFLVLSGGEPPPEPPPVVEATPVPPPPATGVNASRVLFGQSAAFAGPAQRLGLEMRLGIEAAFAEVNRQGGVNGRRMELVSLDDSYEPETAVANTARLIEDENVFALIGEVGTPTSSAAVPIAEDAGVPFIAPFTGAEFLRDPALENVINLRASYYQEVEEMVERMTTDLGIERIGVFYQDDSFGRAGYQGALLALERRGMALAGYGVYPRNTLAVKEALIDMRASDPQAVIMVGAYDPIAELVSWARHSARGEDDTVYIAISFSGGVALARELGRFGEGVFATQVVPLPWDESSAVVRSYLAALAAYDGAAVPDFVSLEGYLAGRLAIEGVKMCGNDVTRERFLSAIKGADSLKIDDLELNYGDDNQGSDAVYLTVIGEDGSYYAANSLKDVGK